jgi:hypothetical protein
MPPRTLAQDIAANDEKIRRLEAMLSTSNDHEGKSVETQLGKAYARKASLARRLVKEGGKVGVGTVPSPAAAPPSPAVVPADDDPRWDEMPLVALPHPPERMRLCAELAAEEGCLLVSRPREPGFFLLGTNEDRRCAAIVVNGFLSGTATIESGASLLFGLVDHFTGGNARRIAAHVHVPTDASDRAAAEVLRRRGRRLPFQVASARCLAAQRILDVERARG